MKAAHLSRLGPSASISWDDRGGPQVQWSGENGLRDSLAAVAEGYGWIVNTEWPVPGFGRIDLLLVPSLNADSAWIVELKCSLESVRDARRACQQLDGYRRALNTVPYRASLCASERYTDPAAVDSVIGAYEPELEFITVGQLLYLLSEFSEERDARAAGLEASIEGQLDIVRRLRADAAQSVVAS